MIAHNFPYAAAVMEPDCHGRSWVNKGRHGPFCVALHAASRRQGAGVDPGAVPGGTGARWLRRPVLLSDARSAGAGCRRQRPAGGNRGADCTLFALFGGARAVLGGALFDQRNPQNRRRGEGNALRIAEESCRNRGLGRLRGSRPQVSNLGARPLSRGTRGGHREGPRVEAAAWLPVAAEGPHGARE
jgi:hypothetical protein